MLKIGGHEFNLVIMELENELGRTDFNTSTICIDKDISVQSVKESTLLHEIIHACNSTFGDERLEHALIDSLAEQLYQVLSDNNLLNKEELKRITNK